MSFASKELWVRLDSRRSPIALVLISVLLHASAMALDPARRISQYAHTAWRIQDGYLGSFPYAIAQTSDGFIWIGTQSGIIRFDGVRFSPWNPAGGERLQSSPTAALLGANDGSLWIGTLAGGLWQWKDQRLTRYLEKESSAVVSIVEGENGVVWVGRTNTDRSDSLCAVSSQKTRCYGESDGLPRSCCQVIAKGHSGNLWLSTGWVALSWKPQSSPHQVFAMAPDLQQTSVHINSIAPGPNDTAWIAVDEPGKGMGLEHFAAQATQPYKSGSWDGASVGVETLLLDSRQALWVGTKSQGLYRIRGGNVDHFVSVDGLSGDDVLRVLEDREGNIWVATTRGVDCFRDRAVATFSDHEGLSTLEVDSVLASKDGTVWAGGDDGLDAIRGQKIISYRSGKDLPGHQVSSLFEDHEAHLWVGLDDKLFILKSGVLVEIKRPNGEPVGFVTDLVEDDKKNIWAEVRSNRRELLEFAGLRLKRQFSEPEMPAARKLAADPKGGIWLGLMNGDLARYRQDKLDIFHYPHGEDPGVKQVSVEADDSVLGATAVGLIGWHDGRQQVLTAKNGLPCDSVSSYVRDADEGMWLSMQCGLVQVSAQQLGEWWGNPEMKMNVRVFDSADGMEPGIAPYRGAARSQDGKLWFANLSVLQMIDPAHLSRNSVPPPVHIEEVTADRHTFPTMTDLKLPALTRDIAIRYTALSFVAPQKVLFRYMLEGLDNTWQDAGTRREAFYTNLAPRSYRFRVIACNNDGLWNETGDSFSFTIEPAYYQTRWFALLCVTSVAGMVWLLYFYRMRQAQAQIEQRLEAKLEEREQIARELHDTLLQGFQGLMLRFQAVMKILPKDDPAHQMMEKVLDRADEVLLEGRQSVRGLRGAGVLTGELAEMLAHCGEELAQNHASAFSLAVLGSSLEIKPIILTEIYRIAREALFNAFQHARAKRIEVELTYRSDLVSLRIRDDGTGIDSQILSFGRAGHWGLSGMRERALKIGATLNIWSSPGAGTEVEITIPPQATSSEKLGPFSLRRLIKGWTRPQKGTDA